MKYRLLFLLILSGGLYSQTFTFTADSLSVSGIPGRFFDIYADIHNISAQDLEIRIIRTVNQLPPGWSSSMCNGLLCYPPDADSISVPDVTLGVPPLAAGDTSEFHLNIPSLPTVIGTAVVAVRVENVADTSENITLTFIATTEPTAIEPQAGATAASFRLHSNYPNPFNPATTIPFEITAGAAGESSLQIFSATGKKVATLLQESLLPGSYEVQWNGRSDAGLPVASGIYIYQLRTPGGLLSRKMLLVK